MAAEVSVYDNKGVRIFYPVSWTVQEDNLEEEAEVILITAPDESFWMLAMYPEGVEPDKAAKNILSIMTGEYEKIEEAPIKKYFGKRVLSGYEMNFFYLDLTSTAIVYGFEEGNRTYIVFHQTTDRMALVPESESNAEVFEAMTCSFLDNLDMDASDFRGLLRQGSSDF
ncbi:MAG: hypothetical protein Q4G69_00860 [Planctomycetia bacterium]|nr:hypothetical protein [Planctomycetia bacterium]